jgi:VanZ family protein
MEVLQRAVSVREFSLWDAAANALGAAFGMVLFIIKRRRR